MALYGWHPGERTIRQKMDIDKDPSLNWLYTSVEGDLPPDHERPPKYTTLSFNVKVWDGDPFVNNVRESGDDEMLMAGIGVEFSTRRRNKFAGKITKRKGHGDGYKFEVHVNEAIGNCPKYIPLRELVPYQGSPMTVFDKHHLPDNDELPHSQAVISFIQSCDTTFFGTTYAATEDDASWFPSHLGMNIRGGRPGFVRVRPSDKRTLVLPDFSGNRIMTSFGNVEATPLASLTLVSFTTGDVLYVTGRAQNHIGPDAQKIMFLQDRLTTIHVTGYIFVRDALPVRQRPGTSVQRSSYRPPVRYRVEEPAPVLRFDDDSPTTATLKSIVLHSSTIATLTWKSSVELKIISGQAIILDFSGFIGHPGYQHMAPRNPTSVNDDRIRTWTKPGNAATGQFSLARKIVEVQPALLEDMSPLSLTIPIVSVTGDFTLPRASKRWALFAGGIGVTPFLSMLGGVVGDGWDIVLMLSTREPDVLLPLIGEREGVAVHIFSDEAVPDSSNVTAHQGCLTSTYLVDR
ncbi:uncharacterized protein ARMOST_07671 [Armillaria ostoyae]|uniref:FAD-binding FR-type domain-containing protein n=1 Tax=Armillaria ostoyae TaxID=47428 RepID=A0A284R6G1_ARMOS|nr:uncharacterized protein ARMOST_07671 [Armillaria ostoyae]